MPFEEALSGVDALLIDRLIAGQRHLSPGSFQKGSENWERTEEQWNQHHSRIFVKI